MTRDPKAILDVEPGTYDAISHLKIQVISAIEGFLGGAHRSLHMGPSVEFSEHNRYSPGDDIRNIDWKALARTDRFFVKAHERDAQLTCLMLLDCSGSMNYQGSRARFTKFDFAKILLGALSHLLVKQGDAVGVLGFADTLTNVLPPRSHPGHLPIVLDRLARATVAHHATTRFADVLKHAQARLGQRGMLILASDLWQLDEEAEIILKGLAHKGHDITIFQVQSPDEVDLPFDQTVEFRGLEQEGALVADPALLRHAYVRAFREEQERIALITRQAKVDLVTANVSRQPYEVLVEFATHRNRSRR